jgi:predicted HAD superfamily Cof-like phosphohydrolase
MNTNTEINQINTFFEKFGFSYSGVQRMLPSNDKKERLEYMQEELNEFRDAETIADCADALVDLCVFAKGTAIKMGISSECWDALFADVIRTQMTKELGVGKRGFANDLIKPEGWEGPNTDAILKNFNRRF